MDGWKDGYLEKHVFALCTKKEKKIFDETQLEHRGCSPLLFCQFIVWYINCNSIQKNAHKNFPKPKVISSDFPQIYQACAKPSKLPLLLFYSKVEDTILNLSLFKDLGYIWQTGSSLNPDFSQIHGAQFIIREYSESSGSKDKEHYWGRVICTQFVCRESKRHSESTTVQEK